MIENDTQLKIAKAAADNFNRQLFELRRNKSVVTDAMYESMESLNLTIIREIEREMAAYELYLLNKIRLVPDELIEQKARLYFDSLCISSKSSGYPTKGYIAGAKETRAIYEAEIKRLNQELKANGKRK